MPRTSHLRLVPPVLGLTTVELNALDTQAMDDACADYESGDEFRYDQMESAYCAGRISAAAWERYALTYERERLGMEKSA